MPPFFIHTFLIQTNLSWPVKTVMTYCKVDLILVLNIKRSHSIEAGSRPVLLNLFLGYCCPESDP